MAQQNNIVGKKISDLPQMDLSSITDDDKILVSDYDQETTNSISKGLDVKTLKDFISEVASIPLVLKTGNFTTESYKRFIISDVPSEGIILTMHTPSGNIAEIFECRFDATNLQNDTSVSFTGAQVTKIEGDNDTGIVSKGKISLMSAFWNGTTWDVNWKVES